MTRGVAIAGHPCHGALSCGGFTHCAGGVTEVGLTVAVDLAHIPIVTFCAAAAAVEVGLVAIELEFGTVIFT